MAWFVSRFPALDSRLRRPGDGAGDLPGEVLQRAPVAPGIAKSWNGPSQVDPGADVGLRGWVEDRLLAELSDRLSPPSMQTLSSVEYADALRTVIAQLGREDGGAFHGDALCVLTSAVANEDTLQQGRYALQGV